MIEKSKGGRLREYTEAQAPQGIESVEARGDIADGATMKQAMRDELGVSPGSDAGILDAEVRRICQKRDQAMAKERAETRVLMLEKGEIDLLADFGARPQGALRLKNNPDANITTDGYGAIGSVVYLEMNLRRKPFDDLRVRKTLAYAIDTDFIANVLFSGQTKVGTGPIHSGNPFYSPDVPRYEIDLDKARALLDEAGLKPDAKPIS
ncbi:hypothetical protein G5B40_06670 [Pikeienuella piscinae]|uniref:Solute-binding protein family 5 domain-containing protein n=1 Tax=Pikeienuella piscinae TaxID=2748098 RepID=A0A7L5BTA7_9RHOB|nr:ABC transporter substrate-binding protein [Pikeienuella piscinae]QIE55160.1 hypothetical protein G5B40_06670 [Pikeienuella piscinae]